MGWGALESRIEELRGQLDPTVISAELATAKRPRDRVRLHGLRAAAYRERQDWAAAEQDLSAAAQIPKMGRIAQTELAAQLATLRLAQSVAGQQSWEVALGTADRAVALAKKLKQTTSGRTDWAIRQRRTRGILLSATLVTRGTIFLTGYADLSAALQDALAALTSAPAYQRRRPSRAVLGGASLLAMCIVRGARKGVETARDILTDLLGHTPDSHVLERAQMRGTLALSIASIGDPDTADRLLILSLSAACRETRRSAVPCRTPGARGKKPAAHRPRSPAPPLSGPRSP